MNIDKVAGIDNLSGKFLKDRANIVAKPISIIYNLSIKYSVFPTVFRLPNFPGCQISVFRFPIVKLTPLYKKGFTKLPRN